MTNYGQNEKIYVSKRFIFRIYDMFYLREASKSIHRLKWAAFYRTFPAKRQWIFIFEQQNLITDIRIPIIFIFYKMVPWPHLEPGPKIEVGVMAPLEPGPKDKLGPWPCWGRGQKNKSGPWPRWGRGQKRIKECFLRRCQLKLAAFYRALPSFH